MVEFSDNGCCLGGFTMVYLWYWVGGFIFIF